MPFGGTDESQMPFGGSDESQMPFGGSESPYNYASVSQETPTAGYYYASPVISPIYFAYGDSYGESPSPDASGESNAPQARP